MPSSAVDAFTYVLKILDQHWAKTKLARACVRNVNSLSLNILKPFLSHMLWPRTSMSICSYKLGSQGESSNETTNIAMCCSRWYHPCHRFQSLQDFCCCFSIRKNSKTEQRAMAGTTTKNAVFFEVRASWIILGCFRIQSGHLLFTFRFWYLLIVFGSWVFWSLFFSFHARGKSLTKPSHWGRPLPERGEPHNGGLPGRVGFLQLGLPQSGHEGIKNDDF